MDNWGFRIKEIRQQRGIEQAELARRSGLTQSHISRIESGSYTVMTPDTEEKLAKGFRVSKQTLREIVYDTNPERQESADELLERLKLAVPICVPVYDRYPFEKGVKVVDKVYIDRTVDADYYEAYIVHNDYYAPEIRKNDVVIVDKHTEPQVGNLVACLINNELHVGKLLKAEKELWIEDNQGRFKYDQCSHKAKVIKFQRAC